MTAVQIARSNRYKAMMAAALITTVGAYATLHARAQESTASTPKARPQPTEQLRQAFGLSDAFRDAYESVAPSVVNIRSTQKFSTAQQTAPNGGQQAPDEDGGMPDDLLKRFFGQDTPDGFREFRFGPAAPNTPMPRERVGEGTGVIIRPDGYIVTNNHVVDGATTILVTLNDDREYPGTVVGTDSESDLAVVKIDGSGLTACKIGDSDNLQVGEWVLALGSPFGLKHTLTAGIISAKGRGTMGLANIGDFIQTDAAINPGNSGGPLINLYGEVIGINTAISTRTGTYSGVGFAIPANIVKPVMNNLIDKGKVERGWLGVSIGPLTHDAAEYAGFADGRGVLISQVLPSGPAEKAGLNDGDIVTRINGKAVADPSQLLNAIAATAPGQEVALKVYRDGKTHDYTVKLGNRSAQQLAHDGRQTPGGRSMAPESNGLGLNAQNLTPELARRFNATGREGVVISRVDPDSPAGDEHLQPGDVISMVNENKITSMDDFTGAMKQVDRTKVVRLQVFRDGATFFTYLKPAKK